MKLVDILARELKEWPCDEERILQSPSGMLITSKNQKLGIYSEIAENWITGDVSRAQWQAAVDALKAVEQPAWNGEGLPPVGTVCEYNWREEWHKVNVMALVRDRFESQQVIVQMEKDWNYEDRPSRFRPIRTAEQIAAEEREKGIDEMVQFFMNYYGNPKGAEEYFLICRSLYDAGYRKQVQP